MKVIAVLVICILFQSMAFGQLSLNDSAFANYQKGNYKLAAQLYQKGMDLDKGHFHYEAVFLVLCYQRLGEMEHLKDVLQKEVDSKPVSYRQKNFCMQLANIYLNEKNYRRALNLYNLYDTKWTHVLNLPDQNRFLLAYNKMLSISKCYDGLNLTDSAVNVLTPYVFINHSALQSYIWAPRKVLTRQDSLSYDTICVGYLSLLKKLHTNKEIKAELKKADKSFYFTENWFLKDGKTPGKPQQVRDTAFLWRNTKSGFKFYNVEVLYSDGSLGNNKKDLLPYIAKERKYDNMDFILNKLRTSPLYKMIADLPNK